MTVSSVIGRGASAIANAGWQVFQAVNRRFPAGSFQPGWAPAPLLKSKERTFPNLGWPRETDSLCPRCVKEVREAILSGAADFRVLIESNPGEIKARIIERDGKVLMVKDCPKHGHFEDLMSIDPEFLRRIEKLYPGRDFQMAPDRFHNHGTSTVKYGRGAVLTIDLTNRCNMMCEPCFMDANQVGYVHELTWEDIKQLLDNSIQVKPKRQMSIQFSGGEPTLSPYFLDAVAYAKKIGYVCVQCATNGIRFAQDEEFARATAKAGLRFAYLQFDGTTNEANSHRKVGNLFDVKQRAIQNMKAVGIDVVLVTTIVNTINNDQVGPIIKFLADNIDKVVAVSFQPVSFTGRDEDIDDTTRDKWRYTLSHLVHDVKEQLGVTEPLRDWYPLSATGPFSDFMDLLNGLDSQWGTIKCGCHPNCGVGTMMIINEETKQIVPLPQILNTDKVLEDLRTINDAARGRKASVAQMVLSVVRNIRWSDMPKGFSPMALIRVVDAYAGSPMKLAKQKRYRWRMSMVAGMWFQDLFNYDFRRTEMCIIPYATQAGEISFCAYNTGVGWRQIVENMYTTASVRDWFAGQGRHPVYAAGKSVPLPLVSPEAARFPIALPKSDLPVLQ
ncbi:MAG: radical SAM protein [Acidobacteria bacterium]|nr:MAG: radical SAM protein [Acidobacteriota bacterium]